MTRMCAVSFDRNGKLYYLDPGTLEPKVGDMVLVPTDEGPEVAECVWAAYQSDRLHWYVPSEIAWIDRMKALAPRFTREQIKKRALSVFGGEN